jgi:signal transduction histidine kinase/CheY-like chemotaxis protein/HPt (histidine-containing phosphotransfer) domain-containing protein
MVKRSIFKKMLIVMVALIISLLMMLTFVQIDLQRNIFENELEKRVVLMKGRLVDQGQLLAENLATQVENSISSASFSLITNQLTRPVQETNELYYIILMQISGKTYIHTQKAQQAALDMKVLANKEEDQFALSQTSTTINEFTRGGHTYIEFIRPIKISSKQWGVLRLGYSLDILNREITSSRKESDHQTRQMIKKSLITTSLFVIVGAFIVLLVSEHLSKPLIRLIHLTNALSKGDFSVSEHFTKKHPDGEIGTLTKAFVQMSKNLKVSYEKLEEYNRTLEQKVASRTVELLEARDEAIAANKSKSDFLSVISHEIRTPMNAIIGMTRLVLKTDLTEKQQDYLKKVQVSSRMLLGIINDILDFSKIEAGKLELEKVAFNLDDVLNDLSSLMSEKAIEKGLQLKIITNDVPMDLVGDPLRLGQILLNLVSNALKFTSQGSISINICLAEQPKSANNSGQIMLEFSVNDTGIGLTNDQISVLFQTFSQADKSTTRRYGGTGLGLAICKRMVGMMKGDIHVSSEIDKGSTFMFTALFGLAPAVANRPVLGSDMFRGIKALVVDGNEISRNVLSLYLESFSFQVTTVSSTEQALWLLGNASDPYQLVILDWNPPAMNGVSVARQIKNDLELVCIPRIIMLTGHGRDDVMQRSNDLDLDGILFKPVLPTVLFKAIVEAFGCTIPGVGSAILKAKIKEKPYEFKGIKILLVEDNPINRQVAMETLEQEGFEVSFAINGMDAVNKIHANGYDAVLMDLQMPVMDGYEATRIIRSDLKYENLPIIAMTAHVMEDVREKCLYMGMNGYVTKPVDVDELLANLTNVIKPALRKTSAITRKETFKQTDTDLPEYLPGIDKPQILKNVGGNQQLLCDVVLKFHETFGDVQEQLDAFLRANDVESTLGLLHTLKGVAANLAMFELKSCIDALEQTLTKQGADGPELLADFAGAFNQVLGSVGLLVAYNKQQH